MPFSRVIILVVHGTGYQSVVDCISASRQHRFSTAVLLRSQTSRNAAPWEDICAYARDKHPKLTHSRLDSLDAVSSQPSPHLVLCELSRPPAAALSAWLLSLDLEETMVVLALEEGSAGALRCLHERISHPHVSPSCNHLDGRPDQAATDRCWLAFKWQGLQTRLCPVVPETPEQLIASATDGIMQWTQLVNELAFNLGLAPKYGD